MGRFNMLCLLGALAFCSLAYGFSFNNLQDFGEEESTDLEEKEKHDEGSCSCFPFSCYCKGCSRNTKVAVSMMVDQVRICKHHGCKRTMISGTFYINDTRFERRFLTDQFEDFCKSVDEDRFCFRLDVNSYEESSHLHGCIIMSRPTVIDMGCFRLPLLLTSEADDVDDDDVDIGLDSNDVSESNAHDDEMLFEPYY